MNLAPLLEKLLLRQDLDTDEVESAFEAIFAGSVGAAAIAGLLVALRAKGEAVHEIAAAARVMRRHAVAVRGPAGRVLVDTCGTGGDRSGTFNLSTGAAIVAAAAGATVAKHGNRAVSSRAGSADVLEALGVRLDLPAERLESLLEDVGIAFLFAPAHHGATRHAVLPRRELGVRTVFNLLGPLTNPANAKRQILGVYDPGLVTPMAQVLAELGAERALVVHGDGGLDELSVSGPTLLAELRDGDVQSRTLHPETLGIAQAPLSALRGGDAAENAAILRSILGGERSPRADAVALSAGAALYVADRAASVREGLALAREVLASGAAEAKLAQLVEASRA